MDETTRLVLFYCVIPSAIGLGTWAMRSVMQRITDLEKSLPNKIEEEQVRTLLVDKLEPMREDIKELKDKVDKLIEMLLNK